MGHQSRIIYELTEYAPITEQTRQQVQTLADNGIDVWVDDVAVLDTKQRAPPMGLKQSKDHSTDMKTALSLMPLVTGHKLSGEVCIRLTDKPLNRFYADNADRQKFTVDSELALQFGPVGEGVKPLEVEDLLKIQRDTTSYLEEVRDKAPGKVLVIENSSGKKELEQITNLTGHKILGKEGCWQTTLIQGGISADLALAPQDLIKLHA